MMAREERNHEMKYYAVTDDPRELMHYGIKGMKWGVIRTPQQLGHLKETVSKLRGFPKKQTNSGNGPRSAAYTHAYNKLSEAMRKGIQKAESSWASYNSPSAKRARTLRKNEKLYQKHLELARKGKLKYKDVSDSEVDRITDRLAMERQSRQLSGTEQRFRSRLGAAIGAGIISGVGQAAANVTAERWSRGSKLKTARMQAEQKRELDLETNRQMNKQQRKFEQKKREEDLKYNSSKKKARADAKAKMNKDYQEMLIEEGSFGGRRHPIEAARVKKLKAYNERKEQEKDIKDRAKRQEDLEYQSNLSYQKSLGTNQGKEFANYTAGRLKSQSAANLKQAQNLFAQADQLTRVQEYNRTAVAARRQAEKTRIAGLQGAAKRQAIRNERRIQAMEDVAYADNERAIADLRNQANDYEERSWDPMPRRKGR